eukprot:208724-Amphidinium_carterae.1
MHPIGQGQETTATAPTQAECATEIVRFQPATLTSCTVAPQPHLGMGHMPSATVLMHLTQPAT